MTVQLSSPKVRKILRQYFFGLPQTKIAENVGVDQSSISHYVTRFKDMVVQYGISAAGEEYGVKDEINSLRSLSVELHQSRLTTEEAREGHNIIKAFLKLGVSPEKHIGLVKLCKEIEELGFVEAALKFLKIEEETGKGYEQIISDFQAASIELQQLEKKLSDKRAESDYLEKQITRKKRDLSTWEKQHQVYENKVKAEEEKLEKELAVKMQQLNLKMKEVEDAAALKKYLSQKKLSIESLLKLAKEF